MNISNVKMNNGKPGIKIKGVVVQDVEIDGEHHTTLEVEVYVEEGVEHPSLAISCANFEKRIRTHACSAIRTKDDRIAKRPNIWPDETQHADVYRAWHHDNVTISIWTTAAPKWPLVP